MPNHRHEFIDNVPGCRFLSEQVLLLCCQPHTRRYSVDKIISAFSLFRYSKACYVEQQTYNKIFQLLFID